MPNHLWVGGVLLVVTDYFQARLVKAKCPNNPWVSGVIKKILKMKCTNGQTDHSEALKKA